MAGRWARVHGLCGVGLWGLCALVVLCNNDEQIEGRGLEVMDGMWAAWPGHGVAH